MAYDHCNIFAKILRGEIPCKKVAEDEHTLAFEDINPLRACLLYTSPSPRDKRQARMPSSA